MNDSISAYVASVDHLLARARRVFLAPIGTIDIEGGCSVPPPVPSESSPESLALADDELRELLWKLIEETDEAGGAYKRAGVRMADLDDNVRRLLADAYGMYLDLRGNARLTQEAARVEAEGITPFTNTAAGIRLLVVTMDQRLSDMQRHIDTAKEQNRLLALRLRQAGHDYDQALSGSWA